MAMLSEGCRVQVATGTGVSLESADAAAPGMGPGPELSLCSTCVTPFDCDFASPTKKLPGSVGYFEILPSEVKTQAARQVCRCVKQDCGLFGSNRPPLY